MSRVVPIRRASRRRHPLIYPSVRADVSRQGEEPLRRPAGTLHRVACCLLSGWFLGKVLAIGVLGGGVWVATEAAAAPGLRVASVVVSGNELVPAPEIVDLLPLAGSNVFGVRGSRLEQMIHENPAVASARVEPRLPSTVSVRVWERRPAVVWQASSGSMLIDDGGLALREGVRPLPVVSAPEGPAPLPGQRVDRQAVRAAAFLGRRNEDVGAVDQRIEFRPSSGVTMVTPGPVRVVLGFGEDLEAKLTVYQEIRRHLEQSRTGAEVIDVRFPERPFYR